MKELVQFVRDKKRRPIGCLVAKDGWIGWSLCHRKLDKWNREIAVKIARGRAEKGSDSLVPFSIMNQFESFENRCKRYYKENFKGYHYIPKQKPEKAEAEG